jgi:hypothetical protein
MTTPEMNSLPACILDTAEGRRLAADARRDENWKRWGPYLSDRQWGTVREDYSADGGFWEYFPHDHARSRAYRWGEDGLLGICDREARLCFALAMWNGRDPILKERLFGLTGNEGNHGEDAKEYWFHLDSTPTHSYMKALYRYPQTEFPYGRLVEENRRRGRSDPEFELLDTGVLDAGRYFDVTAEYAKASPDDILVRITVANRGPDRARMDLLPTIWFRNTWSWGCEHEGCRARPRLFQDGDGTLLADHATLGRFRVALDRDQGDREPEVLFTENETNQDRIFGTANTSRFVKDAFHEYVVNGRPDAVNPRRAGTKAAARYILEIPPGGETQVRLRLFADGRAPQRPFGAAFDIVLAQRIREADEFYAALLPAALRPQERAVARQGYAGLLWTRQFYHFVVKDWLGGDPGQPAPPPARAEGRNSEWSHGFMRDVLSMPDKWEYPWFAAWDLAFHMIPMAKVDPEFAKQQLVLLVREWYMHPNGQIPAYELSFGDVNPPVHAWAAWRVYKMTGERGARDVAFLERVFHKLMLNFTWWVNRKDIDGKNIFSGGFLGLDNIGVFDRSKPLPGGAVLQQADGTAWMAFYCATMLSIALELASKDSVYEDVASKFFEHFIRIADATNALGGTGLWDEEDGFYYDRLRLDGRSIPLKVRSMVGLIPLLACGLIEEEHLARLPGFSKRMRWFLENRQDLARHIAYLEGSEEHGGGHRLLAIPSRERLVRVLGRLLDEDELLSPYGIRSLSRAHRDRPFTLRLDGEDHCVGYEPAESRSGLFGGNSNWRGPVWFPVNHLLVEALERYDHFYGETLKVECPTGSGRMMTLGEVASEIARRLSNLFLPDAAGRRPCHGGDLRWATDPHWRELVVFSEYFHGDDGRGLGASHQTGWTALVIGLLEDLARCRR